MGLLKATTSSIADRIRGLANGRMSELLRLLEDEIDIKQAIPLSEWRTDASTGAATKTFLPDSPVTNETLGFLPARPAPGTLNGIIASSAPTSGTVTERACIWVPVPAIYRRNSRMWFELKAARSSTTSCQLVVSVRLQSRRNGSLDSSLVSGTPIQTAQTPIRYSWELALGNLSKSQKPKPGDLLLISLQTTIAGVAGGNRLSVFSTALRFRRSIWPRIGQ